MAACWVEKIMQWVKSCCTSIKFGYTKTMESWNCQSGIVDTYNLGTQEAESGAPGQAGQLGKPKLGIR